MYGPLDVMEIHVSGREFRQINVAMDHIVTGLRDTFGPSLTIPVRNDIMETLQRVHKKLEETHSQPWNGGIKNRTNRLQRRSGEGLKAIRDGLRATGGFATEMNGIMPVRGYMVTQETGATIFGRNKLLTIPLPAALDERGLPLRPKARDWSNTFVRRSRKGNLLIFQRRGRGIVPLYLLKTSVVIPARLKAGVNFEAEMPFFQKRLIDQIEQQLEKLI